MTIDNLVKLTKGELLTSPSISSFNKIEFSANKVSMGDLFIYTEFEDIEKAIEKGAYAILYEKEIPIIDKEIAWIKVSSLKRALVRILRLYLREKSINIYYMNEIEREILKSISSSKNIVFLKESIFDIFKQLFNAKENSIIISSDEEILKEIYPDYKKMDESFDIYLNILNYSLFETTFIYNDKFWKNIKLPKIFIEELKTVLYFLKTYNINYELNSLNFIENHFEPVFIDKYLNQKSFGSTQRVLIFEKNYSMIDKEINFLKTEAKWAKTLLFKEKEGYFKNFNQIREYGDFNFGIVFSTKEKFLEYLSEQKIKKEKLLFKEL